MLAFIAGSGFAEYIEEEQLVRTEPVNPPEIRVNVELTVSPTEGSAPLSVSFTCTAVAVIHELDEIWAQPPQGSVEDIRPVYKTEPAKITEMPKEQILTKIKTYTFKATAEYEGETGEGFVTVTVTEPTCADLLAKKAELEKELAKLNAENRELIETSNKLIKEIRRYKELKKKIEEEALELMLKLNSIGAEIDELREKIVGAIKDGTVNDQLEGIKEQWKVLKAKSRVALHRFIEKSNKGTKLGNKLGKLEYELDNINNKITKNSMEAMRLDYELDIIEAMLKEKGCSE
ncbi:MAG: hypothetical protein U9O65_00025 [Thermotogota bacterium]|nr:hypothetical protein [Thermotogota bacterium]